MDLDAKHLIVENIHKLGGHLQKAVNGNVKAAMGFAF